MISANLPLEFVIGPELNGMLMTPEEFDLSEDWDELCVFELIRGVLVVNPLPDVIPRLLTDILGHWIRHFQETQSSGRCIDLTLPSQMLRIEADRRRCDRSVWIGLGHRPNVLTELPTIAIDIPGVGASQRRRDLAMKSRQYLAAGIREYWVVDVHVETMSIYRSEAEPQTVARNGEYRTPLIPGFVVPFDRLLSAAEPYLKREM